jgi:GAF domain-containing protein
MPDLVTLHENLAKVVLVGRDLTQVLTDITHAALPQIPGAEAASITLIRKTRADTAAYVGQMALDADELQYARGHGPCLQAGEGGQVLIVDDMRTEQRWPDYTAAAVEHGIGSSVSVPLPFQSVTVGALNTYATEPTSPPSPRSAAAVPTRTFVELCSISHASSTELCQGGPSDDRF